MERIICVKSKDETAKNQRCAAAQRVVEAFGDKLPEAKLLCFFDDEDWWKFKRGKATRGLYSPVDYDLWEGAPEYVKEQLCIAMPGGQSVNAFNHFIYLHGSTCNDVKGLTITFAHELHHFRQYMNSPLLWAAGSLIPQLKKETPNALGWKDWSDVPHEREARIVSKQLAADIFGVDAIQEFIAGRILVAVDDLDRRDWEFISGIALTDSYDLFEGTRTAFRQLKPY
jgi:hypothetical protein